MIVDPDFLDHWRTGMVVDALGDPMAPMYILRLWAHCQERKSDTFDIPARGLKAQCKFTGDADQFEAALIEAGFIERNGASVHVCGWAEKNAALLAAWSNGTKGGRPRKETQSKPMGNPSVTHGKPSENPDQTHAKPIREEKSREESNTPQTPQGGSPVGFDDFWALYPRHTAKANAVKAWLKVPVSLHGVIFEAVKVQSRSASWLKDGGQFIPHAASWLNAKRWEDEPQTAARRQDVTWLAGTGFDNEDEARNFGCTPSTASQFRDGKRIREAA